VQFVLRYAKGGEGFGFVVLVGDIIIGVGLGIFGRGHRALGPNRKSHF